MTLRIAAAFLVCLGCVALLEFSSAAEISEERLDAVLTNERGDLELVDDMRGMGEDERREAVRSVLSHVEKLSRQPMSDASQAQIVRLLPVLPELGSPDLVLAVLTPMINSPDPQIRSGTYRALSELDNDAGLGIIAQNLDTLFLKLPDPAATMPDEQARQVNADAVAYLYSLMGLLNSHSIEKRSTGLDSLTRLQRRYEGTAQGREILYEFAAALRTLGVSLDQNGQASVMEHSAEFGGEGSSSAPSLSGQQKENLRSSPEATPQTKSETSSFPMLPVAIAGVAITAIVLYYLRRTAN